MSSSAAVNRVPQVIWIYWVIKIASTTLGETGADMFSMTFNLGYITTTLVFLALFGVLLAAKLAAGRYGPVLYWLVFTASAIAGTAISDYIDRTLQLGYATGSALLAALLVVILVCWQRTEKSIAVETITTRRAELFYWLAFLLANTLGTAAGDFLADNLGLGFWHSALLISGILVGLALLHFFTKVPGLLLFWLAFVLTRPFGATFGDLLTKSRDKGGLDLGTIGSSLFFAVMLVLAVLWEMRLEKRRVAA
ncbi:MAG: hypothetical protein JSS11_06610 [Verrucomicrobia bacterium]|nr:hypothetical protein [Verrucomicrobiota bacterium]